MSCDACFAAEERYGAHKPSVGQHQLLKCLGAPPYVTHMTAARARRPYRASQIISIPQQFMSLSG
jgi:hypothetical protein